MPPRIGALCTAPSYMLTHPGDNLRTVVRVLTGRTEWTMPIINGTLQEHRAIPARSAQPDSDASHWAVGTLVFWGATPVVLNSISLPERPLRSSSTWNEYRNTVLSPAGLRTGVVQSDVLEPWAQPAQASELKLSKSDQGYHYTAPDGEEWFVQRLMFKPGSEPYWFKGYPWNWLLWGKKDLVKPTESFTTLADARTWLWEKYYSLPEPKEA